MAEKKNVPVEEPRLSSDARFSTYKENGDIEQTNPPAGKQVVQELGKASK